MAVYLSDYVMKSGGTTITLRQANCTVKRYMPKNELGLVTGYKDCGTTMKETSSHIEYTNEVRVKDSALSGGIIRSNDKSVAVTCSLPRHADTNINQILAPVTLVNATECKISNRNCLIVWFQNYPNFKLFIVSAYYM